MNAWIGQRPLRRREGFAEIRERLSASYRLDPRPAVRFTRGFFDTFDWRLFHTGRVLEFDGPPRGVACLRGVDGPGPCIQAAVNKVAPFAADWRRGGLRRAIGDACGKRALLRRAQCEMQVTPYAVVDSRGKIRAWLEHEQVRVDRRTVATCARVQALRGYDKTGRRLLREIETLMGPVGDAPDPYQYCLRRKGLVAGGYSTRLAVPLDPQMRSDEALASLLLFLLDIMELNLDGVLKDLDTEFLHDFRIACRRSRTLLTQVRRVLPASDLPRFKRAFAWLSRITGVQRDLDVMLLDFSEFQHMVPASMRSNLLPLRTLLKEKRSTAHDQLVRDLKSRRFRSFMRSWRRFLQKCGQGGRTGADGARPLQETADRSLHRVSRELAGAGKEIGSGGYSEGLHDVRKTGKKLRYLLEAFRSLYPERDVDRVVKRLRKLQNTLGEIVDRHVQNSCLLAWEEELRRLPEVDKSTLSAVRQLASLCARRQAKAEPKFTLRFERYLDATRSGGLKGVFSRHK